MSARLAILNALLRASVKRTAGRTLTPLQMRAVLEQTAPRLLRKPAGARYDALVIPREGASDGAEKAPMPALRARLGEPRPGRAILYLHGGGYIAGSPATHAHLGAALSGAAGATVLLPRYRLAPENPLPAATEDALAAYRFLLSEGSAPEGIALAGDSAGGGLAFLLLARLEREGLPLPAAVVAFSPWADLAGRGASHRENTERDPMLPAARLPEIAALAAGGAPLDSPGVSPAFASFTAPPPALIFAGQDEILRDDARAVAERLEAAGGRVQTEIWPGVPHAWPLFRGWIPEADRAVELSGAFLSAEFARRAAG